MAKNDKKDLAIDKVVDYLLVNIDNPQDLFKDNTIFQAFTKKLTERILNSELKNHLENVKVTIKEIVTHKKLLLLKMVHLKLMYQEIVIIVLNQ